MIKYLLYFSHQRNSGILQKSNLVESAEEWSVRAAACALVVELQNEVETICDAKKLLKGRVDLVDNSLLKSKKSSMA